jgi:hypothetical protein
MAIRVLATIARYSENEGARVSACNSLLDRGWGKVGNSDGSFDGEIRVVIRHIIEGRDAPTVINAKPLNKIEDDKS